MVLCLLLKILELENLFKVYNSAEIFAALLQRPKCNSVHLAQVVRAKVICKSQALMYRCVLGKMIRIRPNAFEFATRMVETQHARGWHHSALETFLSSSRTYQVLSEPSVQHLRCYKTFAVTSSESLM